MLVYVIEENEAMLTAWELLLKREGVGCYTANEVGDFGYIAEDLAPALFICDGLTLRKELANFKQVVSASHLLASVPIVTIGEELDGLEVRAHFAKPLDLRRCWEQIYTDILGANSGT